MSLVVNAGRNPEDFDLRLVNEPRNLATPKP